MKLFVNAALPTSSTAMKRVNILFDEQIIKISPDEIVPEEEYQTIDLAGKIVLPGAVEIHNHLIGKKSKRSEALLKGSKSAIKGGYTTFAEMSYLAEKPIFSYPDLSKLTKEIAGKLYADCAFWANVDVTDYPYYAESAQELWAKGVVGISLMKPSPNEAIEDMSFTEIMDLFMDIYESDTTFSFQGYDSEGHDGFDFDSQMDGIKKILRRMQENPIHIPRVSSFAVMDFINGISRRSDISFALDYSDLMHFLEPESYPAKRNVEMNRLEQYPLFFDLLKKNKIYLLTNNASIEDYEGECFQGNPIELMEYSYHWALSELWKKHKIPLSVVIKMTSENPAKRLGLYPKKGRIDVGCDADFVIYDLSEDTDITDINGNSLKLKGRIDSVWLRGNKQEDEANGQYIARQQSPKRRHNKRSWV